jgi:hypothetical protein
LLAVVQEKLDTIRKTVESKMESRSRLSKDEDVDSKLKEKWENELNAAVESEFRKERSELLLGIQWWMRDVWLCSSGCNELLAFPEYSASTMKVSQRLSQDEAAQNLEILEKAQKLLSTNAQEALVLEVTLLNLKL